MEKPSPAVLDILEKLCRAMKDYVDRHPDVTDEQADEVARNRSDIQMINGILAENGRKPVADAVH